MKTNLFLSWFNHPDPERRREFEFCLKANIANQLINKIFVMTDHPLHIISDKILLIPFTGAPLFNDFFELINRHVNQNTVSIISNLDIYFDDSLQLLRTIDMNRKVLALTRYNILNKELRYKFFNRSDSQDSWIFKGFIRKTMGSFELGRRGCDNRIAYELKRSGYHVFNPSLSIRSFHYHLSLIRHDDYNKIIISEPYLRLKPCQINYL